MTKNKQTHTMSHKKNAHASARVSNKPCTKMHKTNAKDINFPGRWFFVDNLTRKKLSFLKNKAQIKKPSPKKEPARCRQYRRTTKDDRKFRPFA